MKRVSIIIVVSILLNLFMLPYGFVHAEPDTEIENNPTPSTVEETIPSVNPEPTPIADPEPEPDLNLEPDSNENSEQSLTEEQESGLTQNQSSGSNSQRVTNQRNSSTKPSNETKKSSNANLIDLGINPNDFKGFKPGTYTYSVTVPNDVESVNVYAKTQDIKAQITSGTGNHNLDIGSNDINIIVTAEDGSTQTYTINITREEKIEDEVEENTTGQTEQNEYDLKKLEIKGYKLSPEFSGNIYEYKLDINSDITELEVITEGLNDKINIEVVGNTELKERRKHYYNIGGKQ